VFGQEDMDVQEGSRWAVNPMQLAHGWVCWIDGGPNAKNTLAGEIMGPMWEPRVPRPAPIEGNAFKEQFGCEMKCLNGDDAGVEVLFKTPSDGGIRAMVKLRDEIQRHLANGGAAFPCPVLELKEESYQHGKWGKIYKPVLEIVGWCDMNGRTATTPSPESAATAIPPEPGPYPEDELDDMLDDKLKAKPEPAPVPVRTRARRAPAKPTPAQLDAEASAILKNAGAESMTRAEPLPTQAAHAGQRRRPAAR
jgi:hypothetical protein